MTIQPYLFKNIHTEPPLCQDLREKVSANPLPIPQDPGEGRAAPPQEYFPWDDNEAFYYSQLAQIRQKERSSDTLVYRLISNRLENSHLPNQDNNNPRKCTVVGLSIFQKSVKILRSKETLYTYKTHTYGKRGEIQAFSLASKRRLKHVASNSSEPLISQFCMTYHNLLDKGPTVKRKLKLFLNRMRAKYKNFKYLWILEFQSRGFPHFHLFHNLHHLTPGLHEYMAKTWNRITGESDPAHLDFHLDKRNNMAWDMGSAQYLCKYVDKEHQKAVPTKYGWSGRFWGHSNSLVKPPEQVTDEHFKDLVYSFIDNRTGEVITQDVKKIITRQLGKLHEKRLRIFGKRSRARKTPTDYTISCASDAFWQLWEYYWKTSLEEVPF